MNRKFYSKGLEVEKDKQESKIMISNYPSLHVGGGGLDLEANHDKEGQKKEHSLKDVHS
jgi:hypothetical protein